MTSTTDKKNHPVVYPAGKPRILHLLRCQGISVNYYSFTLGRLEATASSTFATSGFISLILGIPVLRSKNPSETAKLIVYIGRQIESIAIGGVHRHGYRLKDKRKRQLFILQGLPGVGPERAGRLLDEFGSVEAAISAGSGELQSVDSIGKTIAEKIRWAVSERVSPYSSRPFGPEPSLAEAVKGETKTITSGTKQELLV